MSTKKSNITIKMENQREIFHLIAIIIEKEPDIRISMKFKKGVAN